MIRLAAAAYRPQWWDSAKTLKERLDQWVAEAAGQGAQLLVFPEYAGCEAALDAVIFASEADKDWANRMAAAETAWRDMHADLAQRHGVWIIAGSLCAKDDVGIVNRAYVLGPNGQMAWQDKLIPTPYERDVLGVVGGQGLKVFETEIGTFGVLICYDSEFPLLGRALIEAGVDMILVPSATDFPAGQTRVRQSCRARAIEGQCLVVQAPLLGGVAQCDVLDTGTGRAAVFGPPDYGLPDNGILGQGETDAPGWLILDVDPAAVAAPRQTGQVGNVTHWPEQHKALKSVTTLTLG